MNCSLCGKPVILVPSAAERAAKHGGTAADYIRLFPTHSACFLAKRSADTTALMQSLNKESTCEH